MDEQPKSIWKKSWRGTRSSFLFVALLSLGTFVVAMAIGLVFNVGFDAVRFASLVSGIALAVWLLTSFLRWIFCWRNLKRFLFGLACFATLIALFYAEENWRGKHDWEQFKREWEAKGEKFNMAGITPAPVPDDQNFAITPIWVESMKAVLGPERSRSWFGDKYADNGRTNFTDRLDLNFRRENGWNDSPTNGDWMRGIITDLKSWQAYFRAPVQINRNSRITTNEFPIAPQPQSPAEDVLLALSKYNLAVEELRQASQLPYSRFPLTYNAESPASILLPHLAAMKRTTQFLRLRALAELQAGQPGKAADDLKLSFRLIEAIRTEPFLISHLVRIAMLQIMLQPVYEGLAEHRWSDAQLVALDAELAKLDFARDYQLSMRGEIGGMDGDMSLIRRHPEYLPNYGGMFGNWGNDDEAGQYKEPSLPSKMLAWLIPAGWFYQNEYRYVRMMMNHYLPLADTGHGTFSPALARRRDAAVQAAFQSRSPYNVLTRMMVRGLNPSAKKFAHAQASVNLARTAIALERYRLAHGEFPESLDTLVPQFTAKLPHDVIGGQPLKYRREANGLFVLYSVGWNETDDGGVVIFNKGSSPGVDLNQGDWVWRYPAK